MLEWLSYTCWGISVFQQLQHLCHHHHDILGCNIYSSWQLSTVTSHLLFGSLLVFCFCMWWMNNKSLLDLCPRFDWARIRFIVQFDCWRTWSHLCVWWCHYGRTCLSNHKVSVIFNILPVRILYTFARIINTFKHLTICQYNKRHVHDIIINNINIIILKVENRQIEEKNIIK